MTRRSFVAKKLKPEQVARAKYLRMRRDWVAIRVVVKAEAKPVKP